MTASKVQSISHQRPVTLPQEATTTIPTQRLLPTRIKRCLFGPPDPAELQEVVSRGMERERKRGIDKWGFDVQKESFIANNSILEVIIDSPLESVQATNKQETLDEAASSSNGVDNSTAVIKKEKSKANVIAGKSSSPHKKSPKRLKAVQRTQITAYFPSKKSTATSLKKTTDETTKQTEKTEIASAKST